MSGKFSQNTAVLDSGESLTYKGKALPKVEGWREVKLGEIAEVIMGQSPKSETYNENGEGLPFYQGVVDFGDRFVTPRVYCSDPIKIIQSGDILLSVRAPVGRVNFTKEKCSIGRGNAGLRHKNKLQNFLFYSLRNFEHKLHSSSSGSVFSSVSKSDIENLEFFCPPLPEQKAIASFLETWDTAIEKTEALIAAKEKRFKWLRTRIIMNENTYQNSEKMSIEQMENMNFVALGRGNVISRKDLENNPGEYPVYSSSVKNNGVFGYYGKFMFDKELITWSVDGGGDFFYRNRHKFSVTNVCGYMKIDAKKIDCYYLCSQLQLLHSRLKFDYQFKAHPSVIRKIYKLYIPPLTEQKCIAKILKMTQQEIDTLKKIAEKYRIQKRGLMQKLLTGEWRISE